MSRTVRPSLRARIGALLVVPAALAGSLVVSTAVAPAPADAATRATRVLTEVAHHRGQPYVYGAVGPNRFDCSGLVVYVFRKAGVRMPRTAAAQYRATRHISHAAMRPGDLIFFAYHGSIGHVAIYAGHGMMWHAPHRGTVVKKVRIYSNSYYAGRV